MHPFRVERETSGRAAIIDAASAFIVGIVATLLVAFAAVFCLWRA